LKQFLWKRSVAAWNKVKAFCTKYHLSLSNKIRNYEVFYDHWYLDLFAALFFLGYAFKFHPMFLFRLPEKVRSKGKTSSSQVVSWAGLVLSAFLICRNVEIDHEWWVINPNDWNNSNFTVHRIINRIFLVSLR